MVMNFLGSNFNQSLARRLLSFAAILSILFLALIVVVLTTVYRSQTVRILDDELDLTLLTLANAVEMDRSGKILAAPSRLPADERYQVPLSGRYWAIATLEGDGPEAGGRVLNSKSLWDGQLPWPQQAVDPLTQQPGVIFRRNGIGSNGEPVRMAARSITLRDGSPPIMLLAVLDRSDTDAGARRFMWVLITAMSLLGAGVLTAVWFGVRAALRPLARVREDIEDVREGNKVQLADDYPTEVLPLSQELNKLLEHNRGVVERAQTHVGNLAHALKTPLAVMMNEAKGNTPLDDVVRRQAGAMHDNVQHYLKRARAAARAQTLGARAEVAPVLADLSRLLNKLFAEKAIDVVATCPPGLYFRGERQDLEEMVGNLMENACKWAASRVWVSVELVEGSFLLHVDDDGNGLSPDERSDALKRGVRLDEAAPGTGLGLSIVSELAEMHEGRFVLETAPELGGLRASLRLPRA